MLIALYVQVLAYLYMFYKCQAKVEQKSGRSPILDKSGHGSCFIPSLILLLLQPNIQKIEVWYGLTKQHNSHKLAQCRHSILKREKHYTVTTLKMAKCSLNN